MVEEETNSTQGEIDTVPATGPEPDYERDPGEEKLVKEWLGKIERAEKKLAKAFKRMKKCRQLAKNGGEKEWVEGENYTVPIINRHINQMVAALYAKNPKSYVSRKRRLMFSVWDGKMESLQAALQGAMMGDPSGAAIIEEVSSVAEYNAMLDKLSETMVLCWDYYTNEQEFGFKQQLKAVVRRTKVNGVGYIKLAFQRVLEPRPEITGKIADVTSKIAAVEAKMAEMQEGEITEDSAELAQLKFNLADLQAQESVIAREGPVFDFPKSDEVIIDPECRHLKTLAGANWIAHKFDLTPDRVKEIWGVDVSKEAKRYTKAGEAVKDEDCETVRVYEVQDRQNQQVFVVCEGVCRFIKKPEAPAIKIERFFTLFPLVFNECEDDDELIPPSDVWQARHIQNEYNRSREGLRQHRIANRPFYVTPKGAIEDVDAQKIATREDHEVITLNQLQAGQSVDQLLQRGPNVPIDPNQYEVEQHFNDMLRVLGTQEAQLGGVAGATATESSIAAQSMSVSLADQVDELDDLLSNLAKSCGQMMLLELSKETVQEIAGPGAVWPDAPMSREEVAKDLLLDIRAGSSGRPNKAQELANMERGMPFITMLPGVNPEPFARRYLDLLEIDVEDAIIKGLPSITAINALMSRPAGGEAGAPGVGGRPEAQTANGASPESDPAQQGGEGAGAPAPQDNTQMGQPGYQIIEYTPEGSRL